MSEEPKLSSVRRRLVRLEEPLAVAAYRLEVSWHRMVLWLGIEQYDTDALFCRRRRIIALHWRVEPLRWRRLTRAIESTTEEFRKLGTTIRQANIVLERYADAVSESA